MSAEKFLNGARTHELWTKIKAALSGKQDKLTPDETILIKDGGISVKTPVKPLTQAEYDGLSENEKQAEVVYVVDEPPWTPIPLSIQEYDTEDGWHVRKWSDGYVEMRITFNTTTTYAVDMNSFLTRHDIDQIPKLPLELNTTYTDVYSLNSLTTVGWLGSDKGTLRIITGITKNKIDVSLTREVSGRWK